LREENVSTWGDHWQGLGERELLRALGRHLTPEGLKRIEQVESYLRAGAGRASRVRRSREDLRQTIEGKERRYM
jgi:hypothetical protein